MQVLDIKRRIRPAFTLIEMLFVIAIIGVLAALSTAAYFYAVGRQYEKNTSASIEHIYGVFKKQWNAVIEEAKKEPIPDAIRKLAESDPSGDRARVLLVKFRLAEAFPGTFTDIKDYTNSLSTRYLYNYLPSAQARYSGNYYKQWSDVTKANSKTAYDFGLSGRNLQLQLQRESSACLYMALSSAKGGSVVNADQLPTRAYDIDFNGALPDGLMRVFGDAWGNPIAFFRFPTCPSNPTANNPFTARKPSAWTYNDPLDPKGTLASATWLVANKAIYENIMGYEVGSNFTIPVIVSAGKDEILDLRFRDPAVILETSWDTWLTPPLLWPYNDMALLSHEKSPNVAPYNCTKDNIYSFNIVAP